MWSKLDTDATSTKIRVNQSQLSTPFALRAAGAIVLTDRAPSEARRFFGVIGNSDRLWQYWSEARKIIFRALNRRSQRLSFNWTGFSQMWKTLAIPNPHIVEKPYRRNHTWKLSYR